MRDCNNRRRAQARDVAREVSVSVWLTIPSKRPIEEAEPILKLWDERGYNIALWCDDFTKHEGAPFGSWYGLFGEYPGYANAVNALIRHVIQRDLSAEWFIAAGDDVEPDMNHSAEEIETKCRAFFHQRNRDLGVGQSVGCERIDTFGVMQPTGDRWGESHPGKPGAYIDRVCGSAWIGREFARRMYQGNGPLYHEYTHMFVDEELYEVAVKYGVLWQRRDLTQMHRHWGREAPSPTNPRGLARLSNMPDFLAEANTADHWSKYKSIFERRKAQGFPGSEPL